MIISSSYQIPNENLDPMNIHFSTNEFYKGLGQVINFSEIPNNIDDKTKEVGVSLLCGSINGVNHTFEVCTNASPFLVKKNITEKKQRLDGTIAEIKYNADGSKMEVEKLPDGSTITTGFTGWNPGEIRKFSLSDFILAWIPENCRNKGDEFYFLRHIIRESGLIETSISEHHFKATKDGLSEVIENNFKETLIEKFPELFLNYQNPGFLNFQNPGAANQI